MIKEIRAISYSELKNFIGLPHHIFISIRDPGRENEYVRHETENQIALAFHDVWNTGHAMGVPPGATVSNFTDDHARKIIGFIEDRHSLSTAFVLIVNCEMGISRSGAIAEFVRAYCKISEGQFRLINPHLVPNEKIARTLERVSRSSQQQRFLH